MLWRQGECKSFRSNYLAEEVPILTLPTPLPQDPELCAVAVLDAGAARAAAGPCARRAPERCECSFMEEALFRGRPGLSVVQLAWHPGTHGSHLKDPVCMCLITSYIPGIPEPILCRCTHYYAVGCAWSVRLSEAGPA